jgi:RimJ/RimL family protein N-acetyltransferase
VVVEDSLHLLRTVLMKPDTWALTLRPSDEPVGSVGIFPSPCRLAHGQPEIGYWIARPLWGNGYIPEAVRALIALCFDRGAEAVWCAHADFNSKSRRVIEKCGFTYHHTNKDIYWQLTDDIRTEHITRLTKEEYLENR